MVLPATEPAPQVGGAPFERHAARARSWVQVVRRTGGAHVTAKALEVVDERARWVLTIKANPPAYKGIVADLSAALIAAWGLSEGLVTQAADDLAEIGALAALGRAWKRAARQRLDKLQADLAAAGVQVTRDLAETYTTYLGAAYLLGQAETTGPIGWEASFSLVDQDAIAGLSRSGLWWIGDHYGDALDTGRLLDEVEGVVRDGMGRVEGGRRLREAFGAEFERSDSYWRGLSSTVTTRARSFGALSGMESTGATRYEYVNPLDERTSEVCRALDGKHFTVKGGIELRERLIGARPADSPETWKAIAAWPKVRDLDGPDGELLTAAELQAKGIAWPPLHFHCRSAIQVAFWGDITPDMLDGPDDVERAGPRPDPDAPARQLSLPLRESRPGGT